MRKYPVGRVGRLVDAAVLGLLPSSKQPDLITALRSDDAARARYDRAVDVFRVLEHCDVAAVEYDLVEQWLDVEGMLGGAPVAAPGFLERWIGFVGVALALAAALVLVFGPLGPPTWDDGVLARGATREQGLAIEALCPGTMGRAGPADAAMQGLQPASEVGCALAGTLSFAYRVEQGAPGSEGTLSLFGIDADGDVMFYLPTPADLEPQTVVPGAWRPLPMAVDLAVNHVSGDLRLYGIVTPRPLRVDDIEAVVPALRRMLPASNGDAPWHERVPSRSSVAAVCTTGDGCISAELSFRIHDGESILPRRGDGR